MKNLKMGVKLVGGFVLTALIVAIVGITAIVQQGKMYTVQQDLAEEKLPAVEYLLEINGHLEAIAGFMRTLMTPYATIETRKQVHSDLQERRKVYGEASRKFLELEFSESVTAEWQQYSEHLKQWVEINNRAVALSERMIERDIVNPTALSDYMNEFEIAHDALLANVGRLLFAGNKFEGGEDSTSCALGKWLESPTTSNKEILAIIVELKPVHAKLHNTVKGIKKALAEFEKYQAKQLAEKELYPTSEKVFEYLHALKEVSNSSVEAFNELNKLLLEDAKIYQDNTFTIINEIVDKANQEAVTLKHEAEKVAGRSKVITIVGIVIGIALALVLGFSLTLMITGPLHKGVALSRAMADGDMTKSMDVDQKDEVGMLAVSLNSMASSLRNILKSLRSEVENVDESSTQLASIANQMSAGAEDTANRSGQVAAAAEEMSVNQNTVAAAMEEASVNINMVAAATEEMSGTISEIAENSGRAKEITSKAVMQSREASARVDELGKAANEINKVTETITEISEQTNLLALNATIEAARAGEAGKGFAVVANEIKDLAKQTAEATQDIKTKIEGIQNATGITVKEINEIRAVIGDVDEIVATIATAVEEQSSTTREIAENVSQASQGISEVNENVSQSSSVASEIAGEIAEVNNSAIQMNSASSQVQRSAEQLSAIADKLKEMVSRFTV